MCLWECFSHIRKSSQIAEWEIYGKWEKYRNHFSIYLGSRKNDARIVRSARKKLSNNKPWTSRNCRLRAKFTRYRLPAFRLLRDAIQVFPIKLLPVSMKPLWRINRHHRCAHGNEAAYSTNVGNQKKPEHGMATG